MTVIELSAGRKHTIKIGGEVHEVTLRPKEVRYIPFVRGVSDIPKIEPITLPQKAVPKIERGDFGKWSRARTKVSLEDIIDLIKGYRGKKDIGFKPTLNNLVDTLRQFRK